ncbi:MAG: hypothetical protein M9962_03000 [Oligoflexia bacterium]|nr:hypothetical protein [Oligoflexia bacterium]
MKILVLLVLSTLGTASINHLFGTFSEPTQTFVVGYEDQASCDSDGGQWDTEMEMCFFDAENTVELKEENGKIKLLVDTIGSNAHSCSFEGEAVQTTASQFVSKVDSTEYDQDENGNWVEIPVVCEVTVDFLDENSVTVDNNGKCREFCGMRAWLSVDKATRK